MTTLPELFVFDLAGTTVKDHQDVPRVLQHNLRAFGLNISLEEANEVMGIPKPVAIRLLLNKHSRFLPESDMMEIHDRFVSEMVGFYEHDASVSECMGVSGMFSRLKKAGTKIAVDTGFDRKVTNAVLRRMGWLEAGIVDISVSSDEVEHGRPMPDMIWRAMHLGNVRSASVVAKVGDTISDLQEGHAAGCGWVIGVTSGAFSRESLMKGNPTQLVSEVTDVLNIFALK